MRSKAAPFGLTEASYLTTFIPAKEGFSFSSRGILMHLTRPHCDVYVTPDELGTVVSRLRRQGADVGVADLSGAFNIGGEEHQVIAARANGVPMRGLPVVEDGVTVIFIGREPTLVESGRDWVRP